MSSDYHFVTQWRVTGTLDEVKDILGKVATLEFRLGDDRFVAKIGGGELKIDRGSAPEPDAVITTDFATLAQLGYAGMKLTDALQTGSATGEGDKSLLRRFQGLFPLPETASA